MRSKSAQRLRVGVIKTERESSSLDARTRGGKDTRRDGGGPEKAGKRGIAEEPKYTRTHSVRQTDTRAIWKPVRRT